jgi:Double zinc ribbon
MRERTRRSVDAILGQVGGAIATFVAQPVVRLVLYVITGYVVVVWLATALWAFVDMRRRTVSPIWPYATAAVVVVASPLLFPLAVLVHVVIRPRTTVAERRVAALRDAALGADLDQPRCPACNALTDPDWLVCPRCRTALAHRCERCGHAVAIGWDACGWCGVAYAVPAGVLVEH